MAFHLEALFVENGPSNLSSQLMRRLKFINLLVAVIIALYQVKQNEAGYPEDTREVNKPKMSVWAQKAGGSWRSGLSPNGKDADSAITEAPAKSGNTPFTTVTGLD